MYAFPDFPNLVQMVSQRARERGDALAATFITDNGTVDGRLSFRDLDNAARQIGLALVDRGLRGRNLLLLYTPGLDYVRAFFGCLYAGCVPVPAYPPVGAKDLVRLQNVALDCRAGAILSSSSLTPVIEAWLANLGQEVEMPCIATDRLPLTSDLHAFEPHQALPDDIAFLQYTSGSTGHPKGVMVSHGNLLANFRQILRGFLDGNPMVDRLEDLRAVIWLPPFHDMGLIGGVLAPVYAGAQVSLMSPLTFLKRPLLWLKTIAEQRAHISGGPNFAYQYCARKVTEAQAEQLDLSHWQVAFNGAEPIQAEALNSFAARFRVSGFNPRAFFPCYGLAEATLFVAGARSGQGARILKAQLDALEKGRYRAADERGAGGAVPDKSTDLVSSGRIASDTDVRIVNPQTRRPCASGEVGEIWVQSPSVAQGYWDKPQFSASVFGAVPEDDADGATYLRTGDLGFLWQEELVVTGRIKEVVIIGGRNLYPQDIEQTLQESNPAFRAGGGAAFGVTQDGQEQLVILQEVNRAAGQQADYRLLAATGARAVAARHGVMPMALVLVASSSIPKTSSGKIQRAGARQLYKEGNFAPVYVWQPGGGEPRSAASVSSTAGLDELHVDWHSELHADVQAWVADKLDVEPHHIDLDVTFAELGVDSVEAVELVDRLQERLGRTIPAIELLRYPTVQALIGHFSDELSRRALEQVQREEDGATVS